MGSHVCWIATDVCTFQSVRRCRLLTGATLNESSEPASFLFRLSYYAKNWKQLEIAVSRNPVPCFRLEAGDRFLNSRCEILDIKCEIHNIFLWGGCEIAVGSLSSILSQFAS